MELSTMKTNIENNERREQQQTLTMTRLSNQTNQGNLNIQTQENDFSLTTKEVQKWPTNAEESGTQSTSGSDVNTTNGNDEASKRLSTTIFDSVWKTRATFGTFSELLEFSKQTIPYYASLYCPGLRASWS